MITLSSFVDVLCQFTFKGSTLMKGNWCRRFVLSLTESLIFKSQQIFLIESKILFTVYRLLV